jgi:hypothetical protein
MITRWTFRLINRRCVEVMGISCVKYKMKVNRGQIWCLMYMTSRASGRVPACGNSANSGRIAIARLSALAIGVQSCGGILLLKLD